MSKTAEKDVRTMPYAQGGEGQCKVCRRTDNELMEVESGFVRQYYSTKDGTYCHDCINDGSGPYICERCKNWVTEGEQYSFDFVETPDKETMWVCSDCWNDYERVMNQWMARREDER